VHEECTRCLCTMFVHEECTSVVHRGCNTVCSMLCTVSCSMLCTEYSKGCAPSTARVVHRVQQGLCTMLLEGCAHDVCARCLCTMFVHPRVANPMHPSTTFLEETGPKHRVFDPFTGIWAKYMLFWACFSTVSAMSALDQHLTKTCKKVVRIRIRISLRNARTTDPGIQPKQAQNTVYLTHLPGYGPNTCCFRPVSALFQPCPLSTNI